MSITTIRNLLVTVVAFAMGGLIGLEMGEPLGSVQAYKYAHNRQVVETVEAAAVNYSQVGSKADLANEMVSMAELDEYYRAD